MKSSLCALLVMASLVAAAWADEPAPAGDLAALQGSWRTKLPFGPDDPRSTLAAVMEIRGANVSITATPPPNLGAPKTSTGKLALDEKAKPKAWDITEGKVEGRPIPNMVAIYDLQGDTLRLCVARNHEEGRPRDFKQADAGAPRVITWKRVKVPAPAN